MKYLRNLLAVIGLVSLLLIALLACWWNGILNPFTSSDVGPQPVENPKRTHIAHHALSDGDEIVFQGETYDGFFGDGGGTVIVKLKTPLEFTPDAWRPVSQLPNEFSAFLPPSKEPNGIVSLTIEAPNTVWCVFQLQRSGEHVSNLVIAFYNPDSQTIIERIFHT